MGRFRSSGWRVGGWWLAGVAAALLCREARAADPAEWVLRCADAATARQALSRLALDNGGLPAGARLEPALAGTLPEELVPLLRLTLSAQAAAGAWEKPLRELARPRWLEPAPVRHTDETPDDAMYAQLWALPLIQAPQAWELEQGDGSVVLAVVDTGAQLDHPDLAAALWTNPVEAAGQAGVDDDGNGLVDDLHGGDLLEMDGDPNPAAGDLSHGTHTAGTAACVTDNGLGVACPAWRATLMPVRAGHQNTISRGVEGIWYAARAGARVISCSWGGDSRSTYEDEVIQAARQAGALVVASAGNAGNSRPHYPGAYDGVMAVIATTPEDRRSGSSQYGWWADVCAPGTDILSCLIGGGYGLRSGTSMATPLAASLAALVAGRHPGEDPDQLRERVKAGCVSIDALNPGLEGQLGSGRIDALRSVQLEPRAVQLEDWTLEDLDGDGMAEPGEQVELRLAVRALLGSFQPLAATASLPEGGGSLSDSQVSFGNLSQGQSAQPADVLRLTLDAGLAPGSEVRVHLRFTASGGFSQGADLVLAVAPTYVTHGDGELQLSVGAFGVQGYFDFEAGEAVGDGLSWPAGSPSHLYHGSLLLARDGGSVAHAASNLVGAIPELVVAPGGEIHSESLPQGLHSEAEFTADGLAGLRVRQDVHSAPGSAAILLRWTLANTGGTRLAGLQPGIYLDLDVAGDVNDDTGGWDAASGSAWMSDAGGPLVGARWLSDPAHACRSARWGEWSTFGLEDSELFGWLRGGFGQAVGATPDDRQLVLAAPPADLEPGASREVALAIGAGADQASLLAALDQARDRWEEVGMEPAPVRPAGLGLAVAPNPFNPDTWFSVQVSRPGALSWQVVDLAGRRVLAGSREHVPAGLWRERLALSGLASGLYLLAVDQGGLQGAERLLLIR